MITDIRLQQFRSYFDDSYEFSPAVTIIVGPNASGKTNLLEAILCVARGGSYRAADADLVHYGCEWARLDSHTLHGSRTLKLTPHEPVKKSFEIDGKIYRRLTTARSLPVVLFEPNHLRLLAGSPEQRRSYMDELLSQSTPTYGVDLRQYKQALLQRNTLLKQSSYASPQALFPWNIRLSQLAGRLVSARLELVHIINTSLSSLYQTLSATDTKLTATYTTSCNPAQYETSLLNHLERNAGTDQDRGFTGRGPHRDDLQVDLAGRPAATTASRGEIRTAVLALKIIELQVLETIRGQKPMLLLDDVFSELDGARRHALTGYLRDYQTFITTTDADIALASFKNNCTVIPLG